MTPDADFREWIKRNPPPDLQALVAKHGGYNKIPPAAWADFDAAREQWEERRKTRLR